LTGGSRYYDPGELYKTVTKDENHDGGTSKNHTIEEFTDKQGRVVLKRTYDNSQPHDTYYVYDDYGNLTYVLPPKAEATGGKPNGTELSELCYQYRYDTRNRLIEKKIPGKDKEYIVYNKLDQPCMTQDANLDAENKWLFTKYDAFGRVAYTGYWSGNETRANLQSVFDGAASQYETRQTTPKSGLSDQLYYDNIAKPIGVAGVYTINYYDTYLPNGAQGKVSVPSQTSYGVAITTNVKTLLTVSRVRVLTTNDWITTTTGYDKKGRAIWIRTVNEYLDTDDIVELKLDFTGKEEESKTVHTKSGQPTITTIDKYEYDHMGRLIKQSQKINNQSYELIAFNEYDELGQLKKKKVGNTDTKPLQEVDYTYNIRGWLKTINNPSSLGNDLFAFRINYNTAAHNATKLYNGNISETEWRTANTDNSLKWYKYGYDALNRIKFATDNLNRYSLNSPADPVAYDKNGNITSLVRKGHIVANPVSTNSSHFNLMDDLTFVYDSGNKLLKVTDARSLSNTIKGQFNDGNTNGNDYSYDVNGNMIQDLNKGITSVLYNHLNMPTEIKFNNSNTQKINYTYAANRNKLRKVTNDNGNITTTDYSGNYVYENNVLKQFSHPEGYVEPDGSGWQYVYHLKDIWENTRITFADDDNNGSVNSSEIRKEQNYYPFGLEHQGYNSVSYGVENNLKTYQGQEFTKDLNLNTHEWKYRMSDPAIGRFWQIDPLAEKYTYNSTYAFQENKLGSGVELEGLENSSFEARQRYRDKQLLKGNITADEYIEQGSAEGYGALGAISLMIPGPEDVAISGFVASKFGGSILRGLAKIFTRGGDEVTDAAKILARNKEIGAKGEKLVTDGLSKEFKGDDILTQVTGKFEDGTTTRLDNVVVDPKTGKIKLVNETKTGNAKLTKQQERFYNNGESVELVGKNAGTTQGQTISTTTTTTRTTTVDPKILEQ
ncbi:RHS repeat-associated protein, partial [Leeuwenhoekiella aestuarii]|uniref:RHS repeat domain-containing protein n=1 Tax=Leeuwenhoekiella aestuarii TaxID=2249426 RepID=UPI001024FF21